MHEKKRTETTDLLFIESKQEKEKELHPFEVVANKYIEAMDVLDEAILSFLRKNKELTEDELVQKCKEVPSYSNKKYRYKEATIRSRLYVLMCRKYIVFCMDGKYRLPPGNINFKALDAPFLKRCTQKIHCKSLFEPPETAEGVFRALNVSFTPDELEKERKRLHVPIPDVNKFIPYLAQKLWTHHVAILEQTTCDCLDFRVHRGSVDLCRWFLFRLSHCNSVIEIEQLATVIESYPIPKDHQRELLDAKMQRYKDVQRAGFIAGIKKTT